MLRARLTAVAVAAVITAILVSVITAYRSVSPVVAAEIDRGLSDRADTVLAILDAGAALPVRPDMTEQLLLPDGTVRPLTPGRAPLPVTDADRAIAASGHGSADTEIVIDGIAYGVLTKARPGGGGAVMVSQNYTEVERIDNEFLWRTAGITALAVLAVGVLSWLLIGRILLPIHRLATATRRIATTQDLSTLLPDPGSGEVGDLTRSFNTMLAALRMSRAQQQRLVQDAGHELRTPLTSVRGSAELLQRARGKLSPADETQVLTTLVQEAKALDALVGELVDLATDQHTAEEPAAVALADLAEDCAQRFRRRTGRTITLTADSPATVTARPQALARVVDNLLDNATKYSPPDTAVAIHIDGTRLAVRDHGPGIDPADRQAIFDRFYRADRTRSTPGSGLGLAIVHDIIAAHDGTVFATDHPGGGAEVGFRLPPGTA
ncbi:HAMP domain-containing sensor histidine kinase [Nocardia crassostreae]|uniref:HAMP domain-containing sensor histidine kinase n=1 Tax=Nocardia crassostreae TaxID=53428 RepID=UPI000A00FB3C|nr:HAMP domain-containing sensor histidine kinase [Nocardia crassostreae]